MSFLISSPKENGSWTFDLDDLSDPGLTTGLHLARRTVETLARYDLLEPYGIKCSWLVPRRGGTGITTSLTLGNHPLDSPETAERILSSRPVGYPDAEVNWITLPGPGIWIDAEGQRRPEPQLVDLQVDTDPVSARVKLSVHHDVWAYYDFFGNPHPEVYRNNAPRLEAALRELEGVLGAEASPGDHTFFGAPKRYGLHVPKPDENGRGPDVTKFFWL